ncbi:hypothetical protein AOX59_03160 [Lentibacillus amyloliquefaciens]|uniref:Uncharacterized protein n=1 Tax=Lentibacillus amyloliquefaciens TaxID=1472767 RepID=A0A0U4EAX3_9BACI|nr:hypothetical protein AOX59_03160 [Lentibacillus amyloliquefaciens]
MQYNITFKYIINKILVFAGISLIILKISNVDRKPYQHILIIKGVNLLLLQCLTSDLEANIKIKNVHPEKVAIDF